MLYGANPVIFDDVIHVRKSHPAADTKGQEDKGHLEVDIFYFPYGVVVAWGVGYQDLSEILSHVAPYEIKPFNFQDEGFDFSRIENTPPTYEEFDYSYGAEFRIDRLKDEVIMEEGLSREEEVKKMCAVSHGLALCVKLSVYEENIEKTIQGTKHLPEELASAGGIQMSSKDISRIIGDLFIQRNSVNLHTDILNVPDFFWENSDLEPLYGLTRSYLDINKRVDILNRRLDVLKELLEILGDQLSKQNESFLEWVIIWILVVQVAVSIVWNIVVQDILQLDTNVHS